MPKVVEFPRRLVWRPQEVHFAELTNSDVRAKIQEVYPKAPEEKRQWDYWVWNGDTLVNSGRVMSEDWEAPRRVIETYLKSCIVVRPMV